MKSCILFSPLFGSAFAMYPKNTNQEDSSDPQLVHLSSSFATNTSVSYTQKGDQFPDEQIAQPKLIRSSPRKSRRSRHLKTKKGSSQKPSIAPSTKFEPNRNSLGRAQTLEDIQQMMDIFARSTKEPSITNTPSYTSPPTMTEPPLKFIVPTEISPNDEQSVASSKPTGFPSIECKDNPLYRPFDGICGCNLFIGTDCTRWEYLLNSTEVEELYENCPVSCGIPCR